MAKAPQPPKYPDLVKRLRRIPIAEIPLVMFRGPPDFENIKIACSCGASYAPPWSEKLKFEYSPIQSADGARWALAGLNFPCPQCDKQNMLLIPESTAVSGNAYLFGDEAYEWFGGREAYLYVQVFVSIHLDIVGPIREKLRSAKRLIKPSADPDSWPLHTWELRSFDQRKKLGIELSTTEVDEVLRDLASALSAPVEGRLLTATIFPPFRLTGTSSVRTTERKIRDLVLESSIISTTEFVTRQGFTPHFTLEAQTDEHERGGIDYYVERIGRGLRFDLGYLYICRCKMVGLPTTAPKGSCIEMEFADLIAYAIRRYFHQANLRRECEIPLEAFGPILWGVVLPPRFGTQMQIGFPTRWVESELPTKAQRTES